VRVTKKIVFVVCAMTTKRVSVRLSFMCVCVHVFLFNFSRRPRWGWGSISEAAKDLLRRLLAASPEDRLDARQALAHDWLAPGVPAPQRALLSPRVAPALIALAKRKRSEVTK